MSTSNAGMVTVGHWAQTAGAAARQTEASHPVLVLDLLAFSDFLPLYE